ncbi:hypothetical protein [Microbacterium sp. GCS4]|uniref:hypothetical protein n=1 Tax=Microbacterium sp. GCS4 TaxID=1692239 RepID=UPI0006801D38|nr:hypothetical protein [Microbacterium sp. GCS4]KNY04331.1 hypothetical protein AKH00_15650 [Microbacterium sp. GCS4]
MTVRPRSRATDRIGDVFGVGAAAVGTIALHLFLFGGDRYFSLRFLLSPVENPISFAAFVLTLVLLAVALVRASRAGAWSVLARTTAEAHTDVADSSSAGASGATGMPDAAVAEGAAGADGREGTEFVAQPGEKPLPAFVVPGAVTSRALRTAAMVAVLNALFMIVFPIAVIPMFAVIFLIAAALIAAVHIVLRAVSVGESGS